MNKLQFAKLDSVVRVYQADMIKIAEAREQLQQLISEQYEADSHIAAQLLMFQDSDCYNEYKAYLQAKLIQFINYIELKWLDFSIEALGKLLDTYKSKE